MFGTNEQEILLMRVVPSLYIGNGALRLHVEQLLFHTQRPTNVCESVSILKSRVMLFAYMSLGYVYLTVTRVRHLGHGFKLTWMIYACVVW